MIVSVRLFYSCVLKVVNSWKRRGKRKRSKFVTHVKVNVEVLEQVEILSIEAFFSQISPALGGTRLQNGVQPPAKSVLYGAAAV